MPASLEVFFGAPFQPVLRLRSQPRAQAAAALQAGLTSLTLYPESLCAIVGGLAAAAREGEQRKLVICGPVPGFEGAQSLVAGVPVRVCDADAANMRALRSRVPYLRPVLTGQRSSVGLGDRLGLGTPGHVAAGRRSGFVLVFAQQSIREMTRTLRTAQQVMDEAAFGVFQCGYDDGFGSDADHLKNPADVDICAAAGFTLFTIDPSEHVDDAADRLAPDELRARFEALVRDNVPEASTWRAKYVDKMFLAGALEIRFDEAALLRAAVKYGRAVAHAERMARHIARRAPQHEIELSVDETATPTSAAEHLFVAHELAERGVKLTGLAPRFVGAFEKGVDYKGDLGEFEARLGEHAEIARHYGPYKLSIHSGSDKFKVYPAIARFTGGLFHLKTAGTSYLEALRVVVRKDVPFFRELVGFCRERFETDKASYHISTALDKVLPATELKDDDLERVYLDEDDGRQILHVTFGSVLTVADAGKPRFRGRLLSLLNREADTYVAVLKKHLGRHIAGLSS